MANLPKPPITLLGSGNSLGVYVPAVQVSSNLSRRGIPNEICVLENTYFEAIKEKVPAYRKAFHHHFALARKSAEWARDIADCLDPVKVTRLLEQWGRERRTCFIAFTGFWIPILEQYERQADGLRLEIDMLHLDAVLSPSYLVYGERTRPYRHVWFYDLQGERFTLQIPITEEAPVPFRDREERYIAHGGGWGIGTYARAVQELLDAGKQLDVLAYYDEDIKPHEQIRYFRNDPEWSPWIKDGQGRYPFPPLARIDHGEKPVYLNRESNPLLFDVIRNAAAIISKPGGYSLMESFAAATPFVFLEPFGRHEAANADYWIAQGFGIAYADWKSEGFRADILERLHDNLMRARERCNHYGGVSHAAENDTEVR
ncbi:hypothetical protein GE107_24735 [Cohnella sp. CFH 77786]|uniref:hypothetical protein n=1 Tax=Cohnella sp. CFH 77786 TaxID=2662265 RepID=UPI001C60BB3E|nr:hypothetical protein [Cohnella sp. CFH 77786]MBW5449236.1 hypothetical protein [Cohnella sp. CFH 77786]